MMPAERLQTPAPPLGRHLGQKSLSGTGLDEPVSNLVRTADTVQIGTLTAEQLDRRLKEDTELDPIVFVDGQVPKALLTRSHYYAQTSGPFGFSLYQKKHAEVLAKHEPLVVDQTVTLKALAGLAHERAKADHYDPVIVTGESGRLLGIVTINQLVQRTAALELQTAQLANPLTNLPGNLAVQAWITDALVDDNPDLSVAYTDILSFKEYNEAYGFLMGDELIRRTADVMRAALQALGDDLRLGHVGGDQFILVSPAALDIEGLRVLCDSFDREKVDFLKNDDLASGYLNPEEGPRAPVVNLAVAVVGAARLSLRQRHPAAFIHAAAALRRTAKALCSALGRSSFVCNDWQARPARVMAANAA